MVLLLARAMRPHDNVSTTHKLVTLAHYGVGTLCLFADAPLLARAQGHPAISVALAALALALAAALAAAWMLSVALDRAQGVAQVLRGSLGRYL